MSLKVKLDQSVGGPVSGERPLRLHSLRARLLWPLLALILLVAAGQAVFAYRGALQQADLMFDQQMKQMAEVFRLAAATTEGAPMAEALDFTVQIWGPDGQRIYQSSRQQVLPGRAQPGYSIQRSSDTSYRVFSLLDRGRFVQVSQDMVARGLQARKLAWQAALPTILLLPLLLALVWGIVRRSLAPVGRLGEQLAQREVGEFSAMPIGGIPTEIRPLVAAMNDLFHRVEQAFDAQTHFVADAAHELRTPLAALKVQVRNLRRLPEPGERESALLALEQGVDRATRLIEQLLSLARQDSEQMLRHDARLLELGELSRRGVAELAAQAARQSIDLGLHGPAQGQVLGYDEALQILLRNLLENAIKYCPAGATVDVSVLQRPDGIEWVVEDSGPGIDTDDRNRLMRRFHRGPHGGAITGSGLGLAIVQAIAERHDAELQLARSARLGGLRASVRFPLPA